MPALFAGTLPWLKAMYIMHLHSPTSAILSAVIFNELRDRVARRWLLES